MIGFKYRNEFQTPDIREKLREGGLHLRLAFGSGEGPHTAFLGKVEVFFVLGQNLVPVVFQRKFLVGFLPALPPLLILLFNVDLLFK